MSQNETKTVSPFDLPPVVQEKVSRKEFIEVLRSLIKLHFTLDVYV